MSNFNWLHVAIQPILIGYMALYRIYLIAKSQLHMFDPLNRNNYKCKKTTKLS